MEGSSVTHLLKREKAILLSSIYTKVMTIIFFLIGTNGIYNTIVYKDIQYFTFQDTLFTVILISVLGQSIYYMRYAVEAELEGRKLRVKYFFGKSIKLDIHEIEVCKTNRYKSLFYSKFKYSCNATQCKAVIVNVSSLLFGREIRADRVIKIAKEYYQDA